MDKIHYKDEEGNEKFILIKKPNSRILTEAQIETSKIFKKLSENTEILFRSQLDKYLVDSGIWTQEYIQEVLDVAKQIVEKEKILRAGGIKKSDARKCAIELKKLRDRFNILSAEKTRLDANTVEGQCDNFRFDNIVIQCLLDENGNRLFDNVYEYRDNHDDHIFQAAEKLASMIYGFDSDFENKLPENKFLVDYGFVDKDGNLINQDGQYVDEDGNVLKEEEEIQFTPFLDD